MDASETPTQTPPSSAGNRLKEILAKLTALALVWASVQRLVVPVINVLPINQETRHWCEFIIYAITVVVSVLIWFSSVVQWVHRCLSSAVPWFVLVLLLLSAATLYVVRLLRSNPPPPPPQSIAINFDLAHGQIFNSWQDKYSGQTEHITAWGAERDPQFWDLVDRNPDEANFSYKVDPKLRPSDGASSGGYQDFYDTPADRRKFHRLLFSVQSAETCGVGKADVGVRLAVDNPQDGGEYFTYELASVVKSRKGTIGRTPKQFDIPIDEFQRVRRVRASGPLPRGLDENTLNKVVFFVDNAIVRQCPKNTLLIRGVRLER
jgi:hypothetical protein